MGFTDHKLGFLQQSCVPPFLMENILTFSLTYYSLNQSTSASHRKTNHILFFAIIVKKTHSGFSLLFFDQLAVCEKTPNPTSLLISCLFILHKKPNPMLVDNLLFITKYYAKPNPNLVICCLLIASQNLI